MERLNFHFADRQAEVLRQLSRDAGISSAEIMRRAFDYICRQDVLCELIPSMSGQLMLGVKS